MELLRKCLCQLEHGETWKNVAHRTVTLLAFVGSGKPGAAEHDVRYINEFFEYLKKLTRALNVLRM